MMPQMPLLPGVHTQTLLSMHHPTRVWHLQGHQVDPGRRRSSSSPRPGRTALPSWPPPGLTLLPETHLPETVLPGTLLPGSLPLQNLPSACPAGEPRPCICTCMIAALFWLLTRVMVPDGWQSAVVRCLMNLVCMVLAAEIRRDGAWPAVWALWASSCPRHPVTGTKPLGVCNFLMHAVVTASNLCRSSASQQGKAEPGEASKRRSEPEERPARGSGASEAKPPSRSSLTRCAVST